MSVENMYTSLYDELAGSLIRTNYIIFGNEIEQNYNHTCGIYDDIEIHNYVV